MKWERHRCSLTWCILRRMPYVSPTLPPPSPRISSFPLRVADSGGSIGLYRQTYGGNLFALISHLNNYSPVLLIVFACLPGTLQLERLMAVVVCCCCLESVLQSRVSLVAYCACDNNANLFTAMIQWNGNLCWCVSVVDLYSVVAACWSVSLHDRKSPIGLTQRTSFETSSQVEATLFTNNTKLQWIDSIKTNLVALALNFNVFCTDVLTTHFKSSHFPV